MNFDSSAKKFSPVEKTQIMRVPALEAEEVELSEGDLEIIEDKTDAKKITRVPEGIRLEKKGSGIAIPGERLHGSFA
jgi:hypothetical protein